MKQLPFIFFLLFSFSLSAQQQVFDVKFTTEKIRLDGVLDEPLWKNGSVNGQFYKYFPKDSGFASFPTELYMAYDDQNLYVAAKCYAKNKDFVITSYRRDYRAGGNDNISFLFDTFSDRTNCFVFGMNPAGVMREAQIFNGGVANEFFNAFWDNKWDGRAKISENYYVVEMVIPFKTLRYNDGVQDWNFNSYRFDTQSNETSAWNKTPQNQIVMNLTFMSRIHFEKPLRKVGSNISVIPYATTSMIRDYEKTNPSAGNRLGVGGDVKVGVTSGLNLDLTVNPDFSQVESDRQIQNLTRFDISSSFPEQRQFFLENSDLFTGFGVPTVNPFLSRRIGIAQDTISGLNIQNKINYGARLSGKLDNNWRVGLLRTQTAEDRDKGISGVNFTVASLQRKVFSRSNVSAIFVNRSVITPEINPKANAYNSVGGIEYNINSADGRWSGKAIYHQSFSPKQGVEPFVHAFGVSYNGYKLMYGWVHEYFGKGFNAEVGFVPRVGYYRMIPNVGWNFYPRNRWLNRHSVNVEYDQINQSDLGMTDQKITASWDATLQSTTRLTFALVHNYTNLFSDFDPTRSGKEALKKGTTYRYTNLQAIWASDMRKRFSIMATPTVGQYYNGRIISMVGTGTYRIQPYGVLAMNLSYSNITSSGGESNLWLVGPRTDITFTRSLFWTTFIQYNSQFQNLNLNSRLQWRFKPVSDLFLLYTDNYNANVWGVKNRAIVAKVTYWLNL